MQHLNLCPLWSDYVDKFRIGNWYEEPMCYSESSISYVEEEDNVYYFQPPVRKVVPTNLFWYRSKKHKIIEPTTPASFIGTDGLPLEILSHVHDKSLKLNVITLSGEIKELGLNLFLNAKNRGEFRSIYMPDSVKTLGAQAFREIGYGIYFQFSNTLKTIGSKVFSGLGLTDVYLPDSVEYIGDLAFQYAGIKRLKLPANPNLVMGELIFFDNWDLYHLVLPEGLTVVSKGAFAHSSVGGQLKSVKLSSTIDTIGTNAFLRCADFLIEFNQNIRTLADWAFYDSGISYILIPNSVEEIGVGCFQACDSLETCILPSALTQLPAQIFYECTSLKYISLPETLTAIGKYAFYKSGIKEIIIPDNVVTIGDQAYDRCKLANKIIVGRELLSWEEWTFSENISVEIIRVSAENKKFDSRNNCNAIIETATNTLMYGCKNTVIPDTVTAIGPLAFNYNSELTNISIPSSVTSIGSSAFVYCTGLTDITYTGTTVLWAAISLATDWNEEAAIRTIHCSDGDITL